MILIGPGDRGPAVEQVQELLGLPITGLFDDATTQKVRGLQVLRKNEHTDGVIDDQLWAELTK